MKYLLHLFLFLLAVVGVSSCLKDDIYSTAPTDLLTFAKDTIRFDTIIAGQSTHTYSFLVRNKNVHALRLSKVYLEKGKESSFFVNVDGSSINQEEANGLEIGAKDSIRVFLFVNAPETDVDAPQTINDRLVFVTEGGAVQKITLEAKAQNVQRIKAKRILIEEKFTANRPYHIYDSLVVGRGAKLILEAGAKLYFHASAQLIVHGILIAKGKLDKPIVFRGDRLGYMFAGQPYDRISGQWGGVIFTKNSYGNWLQHCDIHSGEFGIRCDSSDVSVLKLKIENSIIHNVVSDALSITMSNVFVGNTQITNAGGHCVKILGGEQQFVHTTIANFYPFSSKRKTALFLSNYSGGNVYPLTAAIFQNSIITGYSKEEIMRVQADSTKNVPFNYLFQHCLLNTQSREKNNRVIDAIWDDAPADSIRENNFSPAFNFKRLFFSFGLSPASPAVNKADVIITTTYYPKDRREIERLNDGKADIGCYELNR